MIITRKPDSLSVFQNKNIEPKTWNTPARGCDDRSTATAKLVFIKKSEVRKIRKKRASEVLKKKRQDIGGAFADTKKPTKCKKKHK